jgi:hypothetical protein
MRGIREKTDEGVCPLCVNKEHVKCLLLNCPETCKFGELFSKNG